MSLPRRVTAESTMRMWLMESVGRCSDACSFSLRTHRGTWWQCRSLRFTIRAAPMASIHLRTEVPGPNSRALLQRRSASVAACVARSTDIVIDHADGALVHDVDGNVLIDMAGGIGMLA